MQLQNLTRILYPCLRRTRRHYFAPDTFMSWTAIAASGRLILRRNANNERALLSRSGNTSLIDCLLGCRIALKNFQRLMDVVLKNLVGEGYVFIDDVIVFPRPRRSMPRGWRMCWQDLKGRMCNCAAPGELPRLRSVRKQGFRISGQSGYF